ncbi:TetR/AcrR family transcriptional regulator [Catenuloplanes atrovinosus]|uniref:AcrR family transcriptional regulator n=1 Tax=Catenuloplanes atrovinosus TaxID=137266 RepID=A0AAE3YM00_9ACTN|nr:TetR/AcrR family transcriptional regulator [Catenuloplanes atrovinosus]MDR7274668.1 AcrR family transcriptional regulator [Catenuloplanes atrovinosus]
MPTGVAIRDVREHLFAAAERVLVRDGAAALTSRAVTTEAGVAKGVLHRHFPDFDGFLAELIRDRVARLAVDAEALHAGAGTGSVAGRLAATLTGLFGSVAVGLVGLLIFRDDLRARLRADYPTGVPLLADIVEMIAAYLELERAAGRVAADADPTLLAHTLIGSSHLLFAGRRDAPPAEAEVAELITSILAPVLR